MSYDTLYSDAKGFIKNGITVGTVADLTRYLMELVQTGREYAKLSGAEKKDLVLTVAQSVVNDVLQTEDIDSDTASGVLLALDLAPYVIDASVSFAKVYSKNSGWISKLKKKCNCCA